MASKGTLVRGIVIGAITLGAVYYFGRTPIRDFLVEQAKPPVPTELPAPSHTPNITGGPTGTPQPTTGAVNLAVPFQGQAPSGDWSEPWQNACEEASSTLVDAYWRGDGLTVAQAQQRILALVDWENKTFGYYQETTSEQTARMIREVYGYKKVVVIHDATLADIESNVRANRPVIVPLAGRLLQNPYYTAPGPIYHMLVVKGIAANGDLITDDVGTRHGHNLTYTPSVFVNAMHDLPAGGADFPANKDPEQYIESGTPAIIVVYPN